METSIIAAFWSTRAMSSPSRWCNSAWQRLLGYYMYHGGENPDGKLTTLMESQATGYRNDMPVKNYDFQAPLGEYGQIRPQYHWLRRLHLFPARMRRRTGRNARDAAGTLRPRTG